MKLPFHNKSAVIIAAPGNELNGLMSRLRSQGLTLEHISSGFQAISQLETKFQNKTFSNDLIILFENCVDMSQREILNLVRTFAGPKEAPIIIFSKDSEFEDIQEMIGEDANDFLTNYTDFNVVIDKLSKILK